MKRLNPRVWVAALALLAGVGCPGVPPETDSVQREVVVCPGPVTVEGIDVSHWQLTINWNQVAADGIEFAYIRVSWGDPAAGGVMDDEWDNNWPGAQAAGIIRGVYQYILPAQDPIAQADLLIAEIGGAMTPGDLPPAVDVEDDQGLSPSQVANAVQQWVDRIESQLGVTPVIYTRATFWDPNVSSTAFGGHPLWVAHYGVNCPNTPNGWNDWTFHQYSQSGTVNGITENVDRNVFNGDMAALQAMTFGDPVCGDGYCTGNEDHTSCPQDCPVCEPIPPLGRIVDETDLCFEAGGDPQWWRTEAAGWDSSLMWTHTVDTTVDNFGLWTLVFDEAGLYRLEAYTDAAYAQSQQANYQVRHDGTTDATDVDQTAVDGWNDIGDFQFAAGGDQWVRLEDLTGEPLSGQTQIVFDAIRITRLDPAPDGGVAPDGGAESDADVAPTDGGAGGDAGDEPGSPDSGCNCRSGAGGTLPGGASVLLWLGLLLWLTRRRRRG